MADGTRSVRSLSASRSASSTASNVATSRESADISRRAATVVSSEVAAAKSKRPVVTAAPTTSSQSCLEDYFVGIQRIVDEQRRATELAKGQAEEQFQKDLDAKNSEVRDLQRQLRKRDEAELRLRQDLEAKDSEVRAQRQTYKEAELRLQQDLASKAAHVQELQAEMTNVQAHLDMISNIMKPRDAGSKRPRLG
ncbi:hypothetical protein BD626DRAFT_474290 [Schizophyllum amplum]|uniref:Uncharacterized protein n=1 Tax=Schizophyllum amplum TaxID=97359 RepID=A0A550CXH0_9AGAR|nr:hypothetical protein BD626DRAFT_474290 [Auriculariopsis ampla]